jgi:VanZ family protein
MFFVEKVKLHWFRLWWALGWIWVALVWYLSLASTPPVELSFNYGDKVGHLLAYGWLMGWFGNIYQQTRARLSHGVLFILMGVAIEFIQGMGATRHFEIADMIADAAGVLLGYVLTLTPLRLILQWLEAHLHAKPK